jgi:hypothetical protein
LISFLALLCNYDQENCLINLGTEGAINTNRHRPPLKQVDEREMVSSSLHEPVVPSAEAAAH